VRTLPLNPNIGDRLSNLCERIENMQAESSAGDVEDLAAIDRRVDALISAIGDLAYLMWLDRRGDR
jgi:hypothetical protein